MCLSVAVVNSPVSLWQTWCYHKAARLLSDGHRTAQMLKIHSEPHTINQVIK